MMQGRLRSRSGRYRRVGLLPLTVAMLSVNLLLPEAAWATCSSSPTTQSFPPESGTANDDVIEGDDAGNTIDGRAGKDLICGNGGPDTIYGSEGADSLLGGQGHDVLYVGGVVNPGDQQSAKGGSGNDQLWSPDADNSVDFFYGEAGHDELHGGAGEDTLDGGPDNDFIKAEDGEEDVVDGGDGHDVCHVDVVDLVSNCEVEL